MDYQELVDEVNALLKKMAMGENYSVDFASEKCQIKFREKVIAEYSGSDYMTKVVKRLEKLRDHYEFLLSKKKNTSKKKKHKKGKR
jgi:hypothetical protein